MAQTTFQIIPASDKKYIDAVRAMQADGLTFSKASLHELHDLTAKDFEKGDVAGILGHEGSVFPSLTFEFDGAKKLRIDRKSPAGSIFDTVTAICDANDLNGKKEAARLGAIAQKHLGNWSLQGLSNVLGTEAMKHLEAREAALARLEIATAKLNEEMECVRKQREKELNEKTALLETKYEQRRQALEDEIAAHRKVLADKETELTKKQQELKDRAAMHERRQHFKDMTDKLATWSEEFTVSAGTKGLRDPVWWTTLLLIVLFGGIAGAFLFWTFKVDDTVSLIFAVVKQITSTILFVSAAYFFIRWNNQWFQKHANEEFRLKRLELDIYRASWFAEMAFEWKDEKGNQIPQEIITTLTKGLFATEGGEGSVEPVESLVHAFMGASKLKAKVPNLELEVDTSNKK
jgi:hypothetical protein